MGERRCSECEGHEQGTARKAGLPPGKCWSPQETADSLENGAHGGWHTGTRDLLYYSLCFCIFVKFPPNKALEKKTDTFIAIQKQQNAKTTQNKTHPHFTQKKITESQELKSQFCNPQGKT